MKKLFITILILGVFLSGCSKSDALKFKEEYEEFNTKTNAAGKKYPEVILSKKNPIKYSTDKEIEDLLEDETGVIYFGFPSCPWCRNMILSLIEAVQEEEIDTINYLDLTSVRDILKLDIKNNVMTEKSGTESYYEILKHLDEYLSDYVLISEDGTKINTGEKRIYVPTVVFVKDGEVKGVHIGTVSSQEDPYEPLTETQKTELKDIYKTNIKKIK